MCGDNDVCDNVIIKMFSRFDTILACEKRTNGQHSSRYTHTHRAVNTNFILTETYHFKMKTFKIFRSGDTDTWGTPTSGVCGGDEGLG